MDSNLESREKQVTSEKDGKVLKNKKKKIGSKTMRFNKGNRKGKRTVKGTGIIYLGRIPHGFYEDQMTGYFSQFGKVLSAHVPRSKKSGRSKGYGFVEFADEEVAKIAAETMNNYLMYNRVIKCRFIPPEERKKMPDRKKTFLPCPRVINRLKEIKKKRESFAKLNPKSYNERTLKKIEEFKNFFQQQGIEFNFQVSNGTSKSSISSTNSDPQNPTLEKNERKNSSIAEDEIEDEFGVLELDTSDTDLHFKIAPQVKKVIKKSSNSQKTSIDILQKSKSKTEKKLSVKNEGGATLKQTGKKVNRNSEKKTKRKEKPIGKISKSEKEKVSKKKKQTEKISKMAERKMDKAKKLKKDKNSKEIKSTKAITKKISSGVLSEMSRLMRINSVNISFSQNSLLCNLEPSECCSCCWEKPLSSSSQFL